MDKPEKTDGFSFVFHATKITAGEIKASFCIPVKRLKKFPLSPPLSQFSHSLSRNSQWKQETFNVQRPTSINVIFYSFTLSNITVRAIVNKAMKTCSKLHKG